MLKLYSIFFLFMFAAASGKATDPEVKQLLQKAGYEMILSPDQSMEVTDYIEKNFSLQREEKDKVEYLQIKSLFLQNNITAVLPRIAKEDSELPESIVILKRSILHFLRIDTPSYPNKDGGRGKDALLSERIMHLLHMLEAEKSENTSLALSDLLKNVQSANLLLLREDLLYLSSFLSDYTLSFSPAFFLKGMMNLYQGDPAFEIAYAQYLIHVHRLEEVSTLIEQLPNEALEQSTHLYLRYAYYDLLMRYYSQVNDVEQYQNVYRKKEILFRSIEKMQLSAQNKWFNLFEAGLNKRDASLRSHLQILLAAIFIAGFAVIVLILIRSYQLNQQILKYQTFISKFNLIKEMRSQPVLQVIPEKTESLLLKKLEDFEKSGAFTQPDLSLQQLAKKLKTNTKYLSEVINTHKKKNFNTYINELRVHYIIERLKHQPQYRLYKIKYLAEESGFTTHSAFAAVFKSYTGLSPINYIQLLKEKEE